MSCINSLEPYFFLEPEKMIFEFAVLENAIEASTPLALARGETCTRVVSHVKLLDSRLSSISEFQLKTIQCLATYLS